jgi:hypothetical protein
MTGLRLFWRVREQFPQGTRFATVELGMLSQPLAHRLFRPEDVVNSSAAAEQVPRRLGSHFDEFSTVHHYQDRFIRPPTRII